MTITEAREQLADDEFTLFADGFDDAFIGLARRNHQVIAIYSEDKALWILERAMRDGCPKCLTFTWDEPCDHWSEAREYFEFNVVGAYVGEGTPLWLDDSE